MTHVVKILLKYFQVFVAPAVRFGYGAVPVASVKHVEPANIQVIIFLNISSTDCVN